MPSTAEIEAAITAFVSASDPATISVKSVRAHLSAPPLAAEAGEHYEKAWLKDYVVKLLSAPAAEAKPAPAPAPEPEPEPAPEPEPEPEPAMPHLPINMVVWGKIRGFPAWPALTVYPVKNNKTHKYMLDGGMTFVRWYGTNQYGYCDLGAVPWEESREKNEKAGKAIKAPGQKRDFKKAVRDATPPARPRPQACRPPAAHLPLARSLPHSHHPFAL